MREYIDEASLPEGDKGSAEPNGMWNRKLDIIGKILSLPETAANLSEEAQWFGSLENQNYLSLC